MAAWLPELVAPGGNLEKLKIALLYGADAVYIAGKKFGLRSAADNFSAQDIIEALHFAHKRQKKVFVVLNAFLHDKNFEGLKDFIIFLEEVGLDGVVVSDFGVIDFIKKYSNLNIHLSTQNTCLNSEAAMLCKDVGIKRIVLGREVSISEALKIKQKTNLEIEMFIHGSMCMSYSGNCVISNYTFNRDSNRGGCKHSCRFNYDINGEKKFFYSSKDLMGIEFLKEMKDAGIDALKIEGRMKTPHYLATVVKAYKNGIDGNGENISSLMNELHQIMTRDYCSGNLSEKANMSSVFSGETTTKKWNVAGIVLEVIKDTHILINVRTPLRSGDVLQFIPFIGKNIESPIKNIIDISEEQIEVGKTGTIIKLPYMNNIEKYNIVRVKKNR